MKKQLENGGILIMTCKERFLKYIAVSTASDEDSTESPSTTRQLELSRRLAEEMLSLGLKNVRMDSCGNAIGTLPATEGVKAAGTLALVAHVDTAPAASGEGVNAREVLYTGEDIELGHGVILSEKQFPAMKDVRGQVLLVTDGSTLLGADDKAGVAEIMTAVEKLIASGAPHGELRIVFTTDEEVGRGTVREAMKLLASILYEREQERIHEARVLRHPAVLRAQVGNWPQQAERVAVALAIGLPCAMASRKDTAGACQW